MSARSLEFVKCLIAQFALIQVVKSILVNIINRVGQISIISQRVKYARIVLFLRGLEDLVAH